MSSDADFQFIVGTILGQRKDSPLFLALDKAGIFDVLEASLLSPIESLIDSSIEMILPEPPFSKN
jgi:hypothetical protein